MKSKKVTIVAALAALGLAWAGVQAAAQDTGRQRGTTGTQQRGTTEQRGSTGGTEHGGMQHGGMQQGGAQASPTAGQGSERAVPAVQQPTGPARIDVRQVAPFGAILVDQNGHALYVFSSDSSGRSACEGECLRDWPPVLTQGNPTSAGREIQSSMLGTIRRADGSMQVTYNQMPLYTYRLDRNPGEVRGQRVRGHGGDWFLIGPNGQRIERQPASTATPATGGERGGATGGSRSGAGATGGTSGGTTPRRSGAAGGSTEMPRSPGSSGSSGSSGERPMPR